MSAALKKIDRLAGTKRAFLGMLLGWSFFLAPDIDLYFNPIVLSFSVDAKQSYRDSGYLYLAGEMKLARKGDDGLTPAEKALESRCSFQAVAVKDQAGRKLKYKYIDSSAERSETEDRKDGAQAWGFWRVAIGVDGAVTSTSSEVLHECRAVWPFDTPSISVPDWRKPWAMSWRMERRVFTWLAQSTLWRDMPIERIKERKVGHP